MQEKSTTQHQDDATVWLLHITDNHLFANSSDSRYGLNSEDSLREVLQTATQHRQPDMVVDTGDIAQDSEPAVYARFQAIIREFVECPLVATPGNHDLSEPFANAGFASTANVNGWRIIGVDTHVDGDVSGFVADAELDRLDRELSSMSDHTLIVGHHPAADIGTTWLDAHRIVNGEDLLATLSQRNTVRGYLSGHVHQAYDGEYERMKLMTTPSTCWQFKALTTQFAIDELPPGWRWLALQADGSIETKVSRLDAKA